MGLFVTFEGIEGSGKTTQIRMTGDYLKRKSVPFVLTSEPGGTPAGNELRKILLDKTSLMLSCRTELLLFAADRAQHIEEVIGPALEEGKVVLCDHGVPGLWEKTGYKIRTGNMRFCVPVSDSRYDISFRYFRRSWT